MAPHVLFSRARWSGQRSCKSVKTSSRWYKHHIKSDTSIISKVIQASYQESKVWTAMRPTRAFGYKNAREPPVDTIVWNFVRTDTRNFILRLCQFFRSEGTQALLKLIAKSVNLHKNNKPFPPAGNSLRISSKSLVTKRAPQYKPDHPLLANLKEGYLNRP